MTTRRAFPLLAVLLCVLAVALIVVHFLLDAGPDKEAPRWIVYGAIASAVAGCLVAARGATQK